MPRVQRFVVACATLAAIQVAGAAPRAGRAAGGDVAANFDVQRVADGVYALIRKDPPGLMVDGNSLVIVNDEDVVVVDAPEASKEMLAAIRTLTGKPIRYVINTHWHDDHVIGNQVYRDAFPGVEFIAHEAVRDYLPRQGLTNRQGMLQGAPTFAGRLRALVAEGKALDGRPLTEEERASYTSDVRLVDHYMAVVPHAEIVLPTITVHDRLTLYRGHRTIEILHLGRGHTSGDLVVYLPQDNVLAAGDLVIWPVPLVGGDQSHVADWGPTLTALLALHPATIVPGHGPVLHDTVYVEQMARLFTAITAQVRRAAAEGRTLDDTRHLVHLDAFRKAFAGDSRVRNLLFTTYVVGPAVTSAWHDVTAH